MDSASKKIHRRQNPGATLAVAVVAFAVPILSGCIRVKTEPIRVEPIYIEITINHRVQKALDDIFADIDQASQTTEYEPLEMKESDPKE